MSINSTLPGLPFAISTVYAKGYVVGKSHKTICDDSCKKLLRFGLRWYSPRKVKKKKALCVEAGSLTSAYRGVLITFASVNCYMSGRSPGGEKNGIGLASTSFNMGRVI